MATVTAGCETMYFSANSAQVVHLHQVHIADLELLQRPLPLRPAGLHALPAASHLGGQEEQR
jgi:hypothetical protein